MWPVLSGAVTRVLDGTWEAGPVVLRNGNRVEVESRYRCSAVLSNDDTAGVFCHSSGVRVADRAK